jgi:hypothetical protein
MFRKILNIFIVCLLVVATTGVTVAKHYCSGRLVSTTLSGDHKKCCGEGCKSCHDQIKNYKVTEDYNPSSYKIKEVTKNILQVFDFPVNISLHSITASNPLYTNINPPGELLTIAVSLADICIFRI